MWLFFSLLLVSELLFAGGLTVSPAKDPMPFIEATFPNATSIEDKSGDPASWTIKKQDQILGYAFETNDVARIPAYSGEPVNVLVVIDPEGKILTAKVLEHHEPILLVGIPEKKLQIFTDQYEGLMASDKVKIGGLQEEGVVHVDGLSGATVTVMVENLAIMRAAKKVASSKGILEFDEVAATAMATIKQDVYQQSSWTALTGDGSIRRLTLNNQQVEASFKGTEAESASPLTKEEAESSFIDLYYTLLDVPTIGRSLLGDSEFQWLTETLKPGEHAIALLGNGFSFKGSGYVRGGIFDRIQIHQGDNVFSFRDLDHYRVNDLYAEGTPYFREMSIFIVREHHQFNPGQDWQVELLVRRQTGPVDSLFSSFKADYQPLDKYVDRPEPVIEEVDEDLPLWKQVWDEKQTSVVILIISMVILLVVIFLQDWLVRFPKFLHNFRRVFLLYTIVFIGWYSLGQISVVNVFTFTQNLMSEFHWETFLLDPVIFCLWVFVAVSILLWGRGIFCGWLCPFGALQELLGELAVKLKIPQYVVPFAIHERLWAVKYLILLALFGLSLESLQTAEQYAEVEPFKTVFLLRFDRDWPFIIYAVALLVISLFSRKVYCRYICPLGAALAIPSGVRLFDWLKRRKECGQPCQLCAVECEIGAIEKNGEINLRECHHCLDCQVTYWNENKCPPLVNKQKKRNKKVQNTVEAEPIKIVG
ncbi:regulatory protein NosR [Litoribacillus peritrichatus]|uniref:Regulatory protein NosR n=1 Tax=Litoribacillus peritrichatus TaxID=718191 RepID=A0ABP7MPT5_9GAMM